MIEVTDSKKIALLRENYKKNYFSKRYSGWTDEFDKKFDKNSNWYLLEEDLAFCRVTKGNSYQSIPIELSDISVFNKKGNWAEINNFNFPKTKLRNGISLIHKVLDRLKEEGVNCVYAVIDCSKRAPYKLSMEEFGFIDLNKICHFEDIKHLKTGEIVKWKLLVKKLNV